VIVEPIVPLEPLADMPIGGVEDLHGFSRSLSRATGRLSTQAHEEISDVRSQTAISEI
jgi:hypothetical protein